MPRKSLRRLLVERVGGVLRQELGPEWTVLENAVGAGEFANLAEVKYGGSDDVYGNDGHATESGFKPAANRVAQVMEFSTSFYTGTAANGELPDGAEQRIWDNLLREMQMNNFLFAQADAASVHCSSLRRTGDEFELLAGEKDGEAAAVLVVSWQIQVDKPEQLFDVEVA